MKFIKSIFFAGLACVLMAFMVVNQVLASDINPATVSTTINIPYQNNFGADALLYYVLDVEQSLDKDALKPSEYLESVAIVEYGPAQSLVNQGIALTNLKSIKPSDALVSQDNGNLRFVLTPGSCNKTAGIEGCNWDLEGKNKWNPKTLACGESVNECSAKNKGFVSASTLKTPSSKGGQFTLTFSLKPGAKISAYNVFPVKVYKINPLFSPEKTEKVTSTIIVSTTQAGTPLLPIVTSSVASSVSSKAISSAPSSQVIPSSKSTPAAVSPTISSIKATTPPPPTTGAAENASAFGVLLTVLISLAFGYLIAQSSPKKQVIKVDLE
jgi:hypothetical protein